MEYLPYKYYLSAKEEGERGGEGGRERCDKVIFF